ncbi:uncharacterized protein PAC_04108 [Phialocephala subalpina]|uniref:Uncharacterized protein n=1 Tax=Phialocephala subalpina TaxID=576137 RepID=A0A1L7WN79_9HELO|nr:uncharacterized protein PAC_04108 [Phialocephala subalpina]
MNRSTVRRLVESTKSRIKASSTPRDDVLSEIEYRKLLRLVDELDQLLATISGSGSSWHTYADMEVIATINAHRESLAPLLHRLVSDSAHANREGRAINRWSYKKKLHSSSKELVDGVRADILRLKEIHDRTSNPFALSTSIYVNIDTKSGICHRTVVAPPPDYFDTLDAFDTVLPEPPVPIELDSTPHHINPVPLSNTAQDSRPRDSHSPRGCLLILAMIASFIVFSCISGIYFTLDQNLGYSMGDAFTLAGYIIAVGALVSTAAMARHWSSCRCWRGKHSGVEDDVQHEGLG